MINPALLKLSGHQNILVAGIRLLEQCKLSLRAGKRKKKDTGLVNFIEESIEAGDTVLDIGSKDSNHLYFMRRKLKASGKIIAFQYQPGIYQELIHLKQILDWKNVELEFMRLSEASVNTGIYRTPQAEYNTSQGAIVVSIHEKTKNHLPDKTAVQTLDNYCAIRNIRPGFLKMDAEGNELQILQGAIKTLKTYKPKLLLKCEERIAGAQKVKETFRFLMQLHYTGYFVLDTTRIPLTNFDFSVYQNEYNDFYCSHFMFE